MVEQIKNRTREVHIGLVGKYVKLHDAYLSVVEALIMQAMRRITISVFIGSIQRILRKKT